MLSSLGNDSSYALTCRFTYLSNAYSRYLLVYVSCLRLNVDFFAAVSKSNTTINPVHGLIINIPTPRRCTAKRLSQLVVATVSRRQTYWSHGHRLYSVETSPAGRFLPHDALLARHVLRPECPTSVRPSVCANVASSCARCKLSAAISLDKGEGAACLPSFPWLEVATYDTCCIPHAGSFYALFNAFIASYKEFLFCLGLLVCTPAELLQKPWMNIHQHFCNRRDRTVPYRDWILG